MIALETLQPFCAKESWRAICLPWSLGEYTYATNGKVAVRVPEVPQIAVADGGLEIHLANCTPLVACRIERTPDLTQTNGWTFVTNVVSTSAETNWLETLPADWTNAFYRVSVVP